MKLLLLTFQKGFILVSCTSQMRTEIGAEIGRKNSKQNGKYEKDETFSCRLGFSSMGRYDESTLFFDA